MNLWFFFYSPQFDGIFYFIHLNHNYIVPIHIKYRSNKNFGRVRNIRTRLRFTVKINTVRSSESVIFVLNRKRKIKKKVFFSREILFPSFNNFFFLPLVRWRLYFPSFNIIVATEKEHLHTRFNTTQEFETNWVRHEISCVPAIPTIQHQKSKYSMLAARLYTFNWNNK